MDAETTNGFEIDGVAYKIPRIAQMDIDEASIFYDYCGFGIDDFVPDNDGLYSPERLAELEPRMKNPIFRKALMHVAYRREHPDVKHAEISAIVGRQSNTASWVAWLLDEGDDADPPSEESTPLPSEPSPSTTDDSQSSSGTDSTNDSDAPAVRLASIGG